MKMINIAYTGTVAAQMQLNTTAMNTANSNTNGYSRQRVEQSALAGYGMSAGNGVEVTAIRRISDQYLVSQLWRAHSQNSYYAMGQQYMSALEQIIGAESTGISYGLDKFFAALSSSTTTPENRALREQVIYEADALATRFNNLNNFVNSQRDSIATQREASLASVNTLTGNIAELNQKISEMESAGFNTGVLRDERDNLINELSQLVEIRVTEASDGTFTVALTDGQPLVAGRTASTLAMGVDTNGDPELQLTFAGTTFGVYNSIGGQLGALHDYETGILADVQATIHSIAENIAKEINAILAQGFDLNGNAGKPLFVFDPSNQDGILQITDIKSDELAFSTVKGEVGNGKNLEALIDVKNQMMNINGLGTMSLSDAGAAIVSRVGIASRQNQTELNAASIVLYESQTQRDSYSAVQLEEEAVNLLVYTQAYQSNLKVMATGNQIFADILALI